MTEAQRRVVERIRGMLERLREIDPQNLTETEQEAMNDVIASIYDRAEYFFKSDACSCRLEHAPYILLISRKSIAIVTTKEA